MSTHMIRYTASSGRVAENEALLRDICDEFARLRPAGLAFETFKLADGLSFVHLITHDKRGHGALPGITTLKAFHAGLRERCTDGPVRTELHPTGTYRST